MRTVGRAVSQSLLGPFLKSVVVLLEECEIPYMLVGSFASTLHGAPRMTRDLDIVVDPSASQLDRFLDRIDHDSCYVDDDVARDALQRRSMFNIIDMQSGWKVDFVIRKARPFSIEEMSRRATGTLEGVSISVASPEDVILAKLEWAKDSGSDRQLSDAANVVSAHRTSLDRQYIERWLDELDVRELWDRVSSPR